MFKTITALALAATTASPALAQAQMQGMDHSKMQGMNHDNMPGMNTPFMPAEMAMQQKMMKAKGANASETWTRKMIEHHRGAVAMSQIVLRESPDAKTRQMAQKAIAEQNKSIGELQAMLRSMGKPAQ